MEGIIWSLVWGNGLPDELTKLEFYLQEPSRVLGLWAFYNIALLLTPLGITFVCARASAIAFLSGCSIVIACRYHIGESYRIAPHRTASHRIAPHRTASHRIASHRIASHRTVQHGTAPYSMASHRIASHRIASHRIASHRIASHCIASYRIASHQAPLWSPPRSA